MLEQLALACGVEDLGDLRHDWTVRYRAQLQERGRAFAAGYDWGAVGPGLVAMYEAAAARRPGAIRAAT